MLLSFKVSLGKKYFNLLWKISFIWVFHLLEGLPWWLRWQRNCLQCGRPWFDPWVWKIPWRSESLPTPVFLPGESHGQRSPVGYSSWSHKESDTTEWLPLALSLVGTHSGCSCLSNLCITICCMWACLMLGLDKTGSFLFYWSQLNSIFSSRSSMIANLHPIILFFFCVLFTFPYDNLRDWGQEEKGTTEDEMAGWHHWLNGCESEWTPGVGDGQGSLACCDSWGGKESDTTERLNWTELSLNPLDM